MPKVNWGRIEKFMIYSSLGAYLFLFVLSLLPYFQSSVPSSVPQGLLFLAVVGSIHYLIRTVEDVGRAVEKSPATAEGIFSYYGHFNDAFLNWINPYESLSEVCIASFTSTLYFHSIQTDATKIKRLKLLLFVEDEPRTTCAHTPFDLEETVLKWTALQTAGQIGALEIRRIKSNSNFYFSVAESQTALLGLLWPNPKLDDVKTNDALVLSKQSAPKAVAQLTKWFDSMWGVAKVVPLRSKGKSFSG